MKSLFLSFVFLFMFANVVCATVVGGDMYVSDNFVIDGGELYAPDSLIVTRTLRLENNGVLETNVFVRDGVTLYIENHSNVNSVFVLGNGAQVIQKVVDADDLNRIDFNVPYSVLVEGENMLSLRDVAYFASGADKIVLNDSILDIRGVEMGGLENVELKGDVFLVADSLRGMYGVPFMECVSGNGAVHVLTNDVDLLFADVATLRDGKLFLERKRETDYLKIFNNDLGVFLNEMRLNNPNDKLLYTLDSVDNMAAFYHVMNHSVRFNSDMLVRPLEILNALNVFDFYDAGYGGVWGVFADDFYSYGIDVGVMEYVAPGLKVGLGLNTGRLEYNGIYDVYVADLYGADLSVARIFGDGITLRGKGAVLYQDTGIGDVLYENKIYENPDVMLWYLKSDAGYRFDFANSFYLDAYAGLNFNTYSVADIVDSDFDLYSGIVMGFGFELMGISYDYRIGADVNTDADIGLHAGVGFMSEMDMVGGNAKVDAVRMFGVMTYKLSLGLQFLF